MTAQQDDVEIHPELYNRHQETMLGRVPQIPPLLIRSGMFNDWLCIPFLSPAILRYCPIFLDY